MGAGFESPWPCSPKQRELLLTSTRYTSGSIDLGPFETHGTGLEEYKASFATRIDSE